MIKFYAIYNMEDEPIAIFDNYKGLCSFFKKNLKSMQSSVHLFKIKKRNSIKSNNDGKKYKVYVMKFTEDNYYD